MVGVSSDSTGPGEPGCEPSSASGDLAAARKAGLICSYRFSTEWERAADTDSEYTVPGARALMSARVRSPNILATFPGRSIDVTSSKTIGDYPLSES